MNNTKIIKKDNLIKFAWNNLTGKYGYKFGIYAIMVVTIYTTFTYLLGFNWIGVTYGVVSFLIVSWYFYRIRELLFKLDLDIEKIYSRTHYIPAKEYGSYLGYFAKYNTEFKSPSDIARFKALYPTKLENVNLEMYDSSFFLHNVLIYNAKEDKVMEMDQDKLIEIKINII